MDAKITKGQLKRLQVLYGQLSRRSFDGGDGTREARLQWASQLVNRRIASFSDLTSAEAKQLIDGTQGQLGVKVPAKPRRRLDRHAAQRAGTEGRHDGANGQHTLVGAQDLARIDHVLTVLGWDHAGLDRFLQSPRGPLGRRTVVRTLGDANKVWWALKRIAQAKGLWQERRPA